MEENISNIEEYRKKRKKKKRLKKLIAFLVILILLGAIALTAFYFARPQEDEAGAADDTVSVDTGIEANGYPIAVGGSNPLDIKLCGKNVFLLTGNSVIAFNDKGKEVYNAHHGYSNPVMEVSSKRVLTYDKGGYQFRVDSNKSKMGSKQLSEKIVCGAVSSDGHVAVVTQTERYTIRLTVYDAVMQEILNWSVSDQVITGLDFNDSGNRCLIAAYTAESGRAGSVIYELDLAAEDPERFQVKLEDCLAVSVGYKSNGNIGVVTDRKAVVLDKEGSVKEEWEYTGTLTSFENSSDTGMLIFLSDAGNAGNTVIWSIEPDGSRSAAGEIDSQVVGACSTDRRLAVLTEKQLLVYDRSLTQKKAESLEGVPSQVIGSGSTAYVLTAGELIQLSLS